MIVIGEKINGSIPSVAEAIKNRDAALIQERARAQAEAGATFIDCCASVDESIEVETLQWMIENIEKVTDLPIAVDSPSVFVLEKAYKFCSRPGLINSVSGESVVGPDGKKVGKMDVIFPILKEHPEWEVAALCSDDTGIPKTAADRLKVFHDIMAKAKEYDIAPSRIHIDPLIEMLCTSEDGIAMVEEVMSTIRSEYPDIHITAAVSNISFNLPVRKMSNWGFTVLAIKCGLDSAILDPLNKDMMGIIKATEDIIGAADYDFDALKDMDLSSYEECWEDADDDLNDEQLCKMGLVVKAALNGLDSAKADPNSRDMIGLVYATVALLGLDAFCANYIGAYREGLFGPVK